jgi:hypothetical protein
VKIFYDTEFIEDGRTIDLISIGMVAEDGRELYAVSADMPWKRILRHDWLMENVVPSLPIIRHDGIRPFKNPLLDRSHPAVRARDEIADEVRGFIQATPEVELWASYGAYDHVVLAQLFGPMVMLPEGVPMFTNDIQQEILRLGVPQEGLPQQASGHHNALADARHVRLISEALFVERLKREPS